MKKFITIAGFALSSIFTSAASAQKTLGGFTDRTNAVVETVSHHFSQEQFNEFNPGIGFEYRITPVFHAGAGVYRNSVDRTSIYALVGAETNGARFLGAGVEAGAITGYLNDGAVAPAAMPYIRLGKRTDVLNIKICYIPDVKDVTPAVVAFQARARIFDSFLKKR